MINFHYLSKYIYNWLKKQENTKEESITDWLLYNISENYNNIYYRAFSRNEESKNGADWEWWVIVNDNNSINKIFGYRFLIQAKKLQINNDNYPILGYTNKNGVQIELLISNAINMNAFPLYMYYTIEQICFEKQIENFFNFRYPYYLKNRNIENILEDCKDCINGCYISPANLVYETIFSTFSTRRRRICVNELINKSLELSIFDEFISFHYLKNSLNDINLLLNYINNYYNKNIHDIHNVHNENDDKYNNIEKNNDIKRNGIKHCEIDFPGYLNKIIKNHGNEIDWIEKEFNKEIPNIDGVGIIDLRKNY